MTSLWKNFGKKLQRRNTEAAAPLKDLHGELYDYKTVQGFLDINKPLPLEALPDQGPNASQVANGSVSSPDRRPHRSNTEPQTQVRSNSQSTRQGSLVTSTGSREGVELDRKEVLGRLKAPRPFNASQNETIRNQIYLWERLARQDEAEIDAAEHAREGRPTVPRTDSGLKRSAAIRKRKESQPAPQP